MSYNHTNRSKDRSSSDFTVLEFPSSKNDSSLHEDLSTNSSDFSEQNTSSNSLLEKCDKFDKIISSYIHGMEVNEWIEKIIFVFARIFNTDLIIIFYIILFLYESIFNKKLFFVVKPLIHVFVIFVLTGILKYSFKRPRPEINEKVKRRYNVRKKENNFSMPSGDSMQAANFSIIFLYYLLGNYLGFIILPIVMFARIFYFCHYLMDTVVGAIVGLTVSLSLIYPLRLLNI